ncbi:hypothetical protein TNCV_3177011 [Trichonephila clavipes]|nr:hypothetical protein TNCV_3177011 [Trichonephila clavipes]
MLDKLQKSLQEKFRALHTEEAFNGWRSKPTVAIWFCVAVDECELALPSNNRTPDLKSPGRFFRIVPIDFDRMSQYLPRSFDGSNLQKVHLKVNAFPVCKALNCSGKAS